MLHKDFKEIYLHLYNAGIRISVMSNGLLLSGEVIEFFKEYPPSLIQVSIYGDSEDAY